MAFLNNDKTTKNTKKSDSLENARIVNEAELIAITDFYPLKEKINSDELIDTEYYELIKSRILFFKKLVDAMKDFK